MNRAVEAEKKIITKILEKMTETYQDNHENLPFALPPYRTSICYSTKAMPYSLVDATKAILTTEVETQSLQILMETKLEEVGWAHAQYDQLNFINPMSQPILSKAYGSSLQ